MVIFWAVAFGYVEAAVVEYLRAIYSPLAQGGFQFPLATLEGLAAMGQEHTRRFVIELGREAATLVMLATVAAAASAHRREAWAHFLIAFGVWDLSYYLWLKVFLDWPSSVMTWDLLFLIPVPWVSPVLAPVIVSVVMILSGIAVLLREARGRPLEAPWRHWAFIVLGGVIVIVSFCKDYGNIVNGGLPRPFHWPLFSLGLSLSVITFLVLLRRPESRDHESAT